MSAWDAPTQKFSPGVLTAVLILTTLVLPACNQQGIELRFSTIEQREEAGTGEFFEGTNARLIFIATPDDIDQLEGKVTPEAIRTLEGIDYSNAFALLVTMGWRDVPGQAVNIRRLVFHEDEIDVLATQVEPKEVEPEERVESSPYHLIEVQKEGQFGREIKFTLFGSNVLEKNQYIP